MTRTSDVSFNLEFERLICNQFPLSLSASQPSLGASTYPSNSANTQPASPVVRKISAESSFHLIESQQNLLAGHDSHRRTPADANPGERTRDRNQRDRSNQNSSELAKSPATRVLQNESTYSTVNPPIPHFQPQTEPRTKSQPVSDSFNATFSEKLTEQMDKLSPATNHPPIGQFTPQSEDDNSATFTSKLCAMVGNR